MEFAIFGATTFISARSAETVEVSEFVVRLNIAYDPENEYIVGWIGITTTDDTFSVISHLRLHFWGSPNRLISRVGFSGG